MLLLMERLCAPGWSGTPMLCISQRMPALMVRPSRKLGCQLSCR